LSEEEAVGRSCSEVLALEKVVGDDLCQAEVLDEFPEGTSRRCEGELIRPGGSRIIVSATYTPLYDETRHLVNLIVNVHDITRFREEEEMKYGMLPRRARVWRSSKRKLTAWRR
jgi:hypothetical protein